MRGEARIYKRICIFMIIVSALMLGSLALSSKLENSRLLLSDSQRLDQGWYYMENGRKVEITLPFSMEGSSQAFYYDLPAMGSREKMLFFENHRQKVNVFLDGEKIYHFGNEPMRWGQALPDIYCVMSLGNKPGRHRLEVRLEGGIGNKIIFQPVKIGSEGGILTEIIRKFAGVMLFSVIMFSFGFVMTAVSLIILYKQKEGLGELLLHTGLFIIIISLWVLTDEPVLQLVFGKAEILFTLSFLCFMLLPLPMLSFVETICGRKYRGILLLRYLLIGNFLIQNLLHVTLELDYYKMLLCTHILIVGAIFCMIYYMYEEYREKRSVYAKGILTGSLVFLGCAALAFADFYRGQKYYSLLIRIGILFYSGVLAALSMRKILQVEEERAKNAVYRSLAFVDVMTGCGNRAAFEKKLKNCCDKRQKKIRLIVADVNGLKYINDTKGHMAGDEIIKGGAKCLREAFLGSGEIFRTGGDEFAVLFVNCRKGQKELRDRLAERIKEYNLSHYLSLSMACGISDNVDCDREAVVELLYQSADERMYAEKKRSLLSRKDSGEKHAEDGFPPEE